MPTPRSYVLHDSVPQDAFHELAGGGTLLKQLLWTRGIRSSVEAESFLAPNYEEHLHDPFLMTDMLRAVSRTLDAVESDEHVVIYSDYDCDGIPGGVVLHDFFTLIGFTNFENYIPHRHDEGFGFNVDAVSQFVEGGTKLIITIDCGTADHVAVAAAQAKGIDVIITDHHEPEEELPQAFAILNPKRDDSYPFQGLCGSGVVYKFVQALLIEGKKQNTITLKDGVEKWLLDMVAIGTIADMVPLTGENRALAHFGLHVLRKSPRPGIQHLLRKTKTSQRYLTEDDIGFTIGPRINAASRMDTPEDAFHMLATKDEVDAGARVDHLEKLNNERKGVVASMTKELAKRIEQFTEIPRVIVIGNPEWKPALVGLTANTLVERYQRPVFLWGRDGQGVIKGSCRSDGTTSVIALMREAEDSFEEFGGHHGAGGFSVTDEGIHTLADKLCAAHEKISLMPTSDNETMVDADLALDDVHYNLTQTLRQLAPYGEGNAKPLFRFQNVTPTSVEIFGKTKEHAKLIFQTSRGTIEAIAFFRTPDSFHLIPDVTKACTLIAHVEESFFMGRLQTRLRIVDIV